MLMLAACHSSISLVGAEAIICASNNQTQTQQHPITFKLLKKDVCVCVCVCVTQCQHPKGQSLVTGKVRPSWRLQLLFQADLAGQVHSETLGMLLGSQNADEHHTRHQHRTGT